MLTACTGAPDGDSAVYRNSAVPIYSSAVLDSARMVGQWRQVAGFGPQDSACRPGGANITAGPQGLRAVLRLCLAGQDQAAAASLLPAGPGRFALADDAWPEPWWVLWADADMRTLVIGTPSGRFGFILNRDGTLPADRLAAAREILDWNGYDLTRLQVWP